MWGALVILVSLGAQWVVYERIFDDPGGMRFISPILAGVTTAAFVFRLQLLTQRQQLSQLRRLHVISEMNHHIRNAMQVISCGTYVTNPQAHDSMQSAMNRIDWALRDVLPQVTEEKEEEFRAPTP